MKRLPIESGRQEPFDGASAEANIYRRSSNAETASAKMFRRTMITRQKLFGETLGINAIMLARR